jgi:tricorn protease-like protein
MVIGFVEDGRILTHSSNTSPVTTWPHLLFLMKEGGHLVERLNVGFLRKRRAQWL